MLVFGLIVGFELSDSFEIHGFVLGRVVVHLESVHKLLLAPHLTIHLDIISYFATVFLCCLPLLGRVELRL